MGILVVTAFFLACTLCKIVANVSPHHRDSGNATNSQARKYFKNEFARNNPHSVETMLLYREHEIFQQTAAEAKTQGYSIKGFYHTSTWQPKWATVITEQLKLLDGQRRIPKDVNDPLTTYAWESKISWTSLLEVSTELYLNVAGPTNEDAKKMQQLVDQVELKFKKKIHINFNQTVAREEYGNGNEEKRKKLFSQPQLTSGEHATIDTLHDYCSAKAANGEKALVYYLHSKLVLYA